MSSVQTLACIIWQRAIRPAQTRNAYAPRSSFLLREHGGNLCLGEIVVSDSISQNSEDLGNDSISQKNENLVSDSISQKSENLVSDSISQTKVVFCSSGDVPPTKMNHFSMRNPIFDTPEAQTHEK